MTATKYSTMGKISQDGNGAGTANSAATDRASPASTARIITAGTSVKSATSRSSKYGRAMSSAAIRSLIAGGGGVSSTLASHCSPTMTAMAPNSSAVSTVARWRCRTAEPRATTKMTTKIAWVMSWSSSSALIRQSHDEQNRSATARRAARSRGSF